MRRARQQQQQQQLWVYIGLSVCVSGKQHRLHQNQSDRLLQRSQTPHSYRSVHRLTCRPTHTNVRPKPSSRRNPAPGQNPLWRRNSSYLLTATRHKWSRPALTLARQVCTRITHLWRMEGGVNIDVDYIPRWLICPSDTKDTLRNRRVCFNTLSDCHLW